MLTSFFTHKTKPPALWLAAPLLAIVCLSSCTASKKGYSYRSPNVNNPRSEVIELADDDTPVVTIETGDAVDVPIATPSVLTARQQQMSRIVTRSRDFIGTRYKWGGTSISGMDCSGLLCASYKEVGHQLPRMARDQSQAGPALAVHELQPGDLVFFGGSPGSTRISHAGMVTEVNSTDEIRFIHASSSRGVVEDNLMSNYYSQRFIRGVRIALNITK